MSDFSYKLIKKALDVSSLRQKNISSNIANVNTPDYKVNKVKFEEYLKQALDKDEVYMKKTSANHLGGIDEPLNIKPVVTKDTETKIKDNGNNVDIDYEMTNMAANEIYYYTLIEQLNGKLESIKYVINK